MLQQVKKWASQRKNSRLFAIALGLGLGLGMSNLSLMAQDQPRQRPQGQRGPSSFQRGGFSQGGSSSGLLRNPQIQKELNLIDEQIEELKALEEEQRDALRAAMEEVQKKFANKVNDVLLPEQVTRLKQIQYQMQGTRGFSQEGGIAEELGITEKQKEELSSLRDGLRPKYEEVFAKLRSGEIERDSIREKMDELRKDAEKAVFDVLTNEQKEKLKKLQGDKFELERSSFQRGGFGGGQRPGGQGRPGGTSPATPNSDGV